MKNPSGLSIAHWNWSMKIKILFPLLFSPSLLRSPCMGFCRWVKRKKTFNMYSMSPHISLEPFVLYRVMGLCLEKDGKLGIGFFLSRHLCFCLEWKLMVFIQCVLLSSFTEQYLAMRNMCTSRQNQKQTI